MLLSSAIDIIDNCGAIAAKRDRVIAWHRIKKELSELAAQSGEAPVQQLKAEIDALATELNGVCESFDCNLHCGNIIAKLRQLSAV